MTEGLFAPLTLPNGSVLPNRLAKAAMEERLAGRGQVPGELLWELYGRWARGGAGLIITGNVMVDARALTSPAAVVLDAASSLAPFERWAAAAKAGGGQAWMQINHPGRQVWADMPGVRLAPSAVSLELGRQSKRFAVPSAMTGLEIGRLVDSFVLTAKRAAEAGFDGVQIHAAHGYLLSQFLSPLSNRRTDEWGGSLVNRARLLVDVVGRVRAAVPAGFAVAVKVNTADFQRGGFEFKDALRVIELLNELEVDLVELSGGTYESPAMQGMPQDERTAAREAYFLEFAQKALQIATMPLMLTGGIARRDIAEQVRADGVSVIGMATALSVEPDLPNQWKDGTTTAVSLSPIAWQDKALASAARQAFVRAQLRRAATRHAPRPQGSPRLALAADELRRRLALRRYRRWLRSREQLPSGSGASAVS